MLSRRVSVLPAAIVWVTVANFDHAGERVTQVDWGRDARTVRPMRDQRAGATAPDADLNEASI
jgi:hypothetical protein